MISKLRKPIAAVFSAASFLALAPSAALAQDAQAAEFKSIFDSALGTEARAPQTFEAVYSTDLERRVADLADGSRGRIGVYAIDLSTGQEVGVLADQRFPMASTSKVAIAATFLAGVDQGKWSLTSEFPLLIPVASGKFSSSRAPVREGNYVPAQRLIDLMIAKSCNTCTDALLRVVGGPEAVNKWMRGAGIEGFQLTRDIATLVRDDGEFDPATQIDLRDSATPRAMGQLLAGVHQGKWLSPRSRSVLLNAMGQTTTGRNRMKAALPSYADLAHKTGTLSRTASDIGIFRLPDGRQVAAAIFVTGQSANLVDEARNKAGAKAKRDQRIASITRALYDGFAAQPTMAQRQVWTSAPYGGN